jgi:uncharacterized protein (DUF2236 family)
VACFASTPKLDKRCAALGTFAAHSCRRRESEDRWTAGELSYRRRWSSPRQLGKRDPAVSTVTCGVAACDHRPLGPSSLLWRYAGDRRLAFTGLTAGLLQLMHPAIGAGVAQHSDFFADPWDRIGRSVPEILGVVYDPDPEGTGRRVRDYHRRIRGVDHLGRPYQALDPASFWWAHATFQWAVEAVVDRFSTHRLTDPERAELYRDGVEWYRRYGVSMAPVPADRAAFSTAWDDCCESVLEMTPAADRAVDMAVHATLELPPWFPAWATLLERPLVVPVLRLCTLGGLPPAVRRRFAIPWSPLDEARYVAFQLTIRQAWPHLSYPRQRNPRALAGERARADLEAAGG